MEFAYTREAWYARNGRVLPWRETQDPYRVWVSEIVLQQTRVEQGLGYYARFVQEFPDVAHLASASADHVMRVWEGLGYYSRARNMHCAARQIVALGAFPTCYEELRKLKGVGDYTAAAVASFCFGEARAVVDGNVYRVLARYFGLETPIDTAAGKREFRDLAQSVMDKKRPALYNQAIMDFGALQCTPKRPDCDSCPLAGSCQAFAGKRVGELPKKSRHVAITERHFTYVVVQNADDALLVHRRSGKDIWQGLYEPVLFERPEGRHELSPAEMLQGWLQQQGISIPARSMQVEGHVPALRHQLTHRMVLAEAYRIRLSPEAVVPAPEHVRWLLPGMLGNYAFPRLVNRICKQFGIR